MKFTLAWLKEHLQTDASLSVVVETLTRIGLEVEDVQDPSERIGAFTIAKVLTAAPHPQADKLQVLTVDTGAEGGPVQVVCGAPNARTGLVGVFGSPGTYVPGSDITLKVTAIRGVESHGMMCSMRELDLSEEHDGIIELPDDAPLGVQYASWAGLDDPVIEIAVTPNRQDCMGVRGVARDLAAAGIGTLKPLDLPRIIEKGTSPIAIRTDDPSGCPAFFGRVIKGVKNGPAPDWLQRRLIAVGQRPISALVDITNYIMIGLGRPLHVYDLAKLSGALVARRARTGEKVLALNGKEYVLDDSMTVIGDDHMVHDIGGIMGGEHSGVTDTTTDVVIECAYFTPEAIARTGQTLNLTSDARTRFERGVDPAFLSDGLTIATKMIIDLCGGAPTAAVQSGEPPVSSRTIHYDAAAPTRLAGVQLSPERQRDILRRLGFGLDAAWNVAVPSWRRDVEEVADLVEEVVRIEGIDKVPSTPLPRSEGVARPTATAGQLIERSARRAAAAAGLCEAITWSFLSEAEASAFDGASWFLANPISEEMKVMRPSLLPGLLSAARRNLDRGLSSMRLFEIGRRYLEEGERPTLGLVLAGDRQERDWRTGPSRSFDAYDVKAAVYRLLDAMGAPIERLKVMTPVSGEYHPGRSASLRLGPKMILAEFGELHPALASRLDMNVPTMVGQIYLDVIPQHKGSSRTRSAYTPPQLQAVRRDFAFLAPLALQSDDLIRAVRSSDKDYIADVRLFDVFTGKGVAEGEKSLALEVILQPLLKSFTEEELRGLSEKIVQSAQKLGVRLRIGE
jgi:phenylalanyl-tRNA synthetase beta chain